MSLWNSDLFVKETEILDDNFLLVKGRWVPNNSFIYVVNVYALNSRSGREELWLKLANLKETDQRAGWVFCGDFNEIRKPEERCGSMFCTRGAQAFNAWIDSLDLSEPSLGGKNTLGLVQTAKSTTN